MFRGKRYSKEERIFSFQHRLLSYQNFCSVWSINFQTAPPSDRFRKRLQKKFSVSGSIADLPRCGRPRTARTEQNIFATAIYFSERFYEKKVDLSNERPTKKMAADNIGISSTSIQRILKLDVKWRSLFPRRVQSLNNKDIENRKLYGQQMQEILRHNPDFLDLIVWTDEALFKLNGQVRTNLLRYWSDGSVKKVYPKKNKRQGTMVTIGIWRFGIIGPFFFDDLPKIHADSSCRKSKTEKIDHKKYLQMLKTCYLPEIEAQLPLDDKNVKSNLWFQLDGASIHTAKPVETFLNKTFRSRWIGNKGPIRWPPNSPDLTPLGLSSNFIICIDCCTIVFYRFQLMGSIAF